MYTLRNFPEGKKCVVIEDRIGLPALTRMLKWSPNTIGPVLHPTFMDEAVIEALLIDGCKKIYALNPENYEQRILLTKENFAVPYVRLFNPDQDEEVVETAEIIEPVDVITGENGEVIVVDETISSDTVQVLNEIPLPLTNVVDTGEVITGTEQPTEGLEEATGTEPTAEGLEEATGTEPTTEGLEEATGAEQPAPAKQKPNMHNKRHNNK